MEILNQILPIITGGGIPVILFIIWYFTFTRANQQHDAAIKFANERFTEAMEESRKRYDDSIRHSNELFERASNRHDKLIAELVSIQKEEAKSKELMVGLLSSMNTKLDRK